MNRIRWDDCLSLGISRLDDQHKNLLNIINNYLLAREMNPTRRLLDQTFSQLREYAKIHFRDEEKFMERIGYPELAEHRAQHLAMSARLKDYTQRLYRKEEIDSREISDFMKDWLIGHILAWDCKLADFERDKDTGQSINSGAPSAPGDSLESPPKVHGNDKGDDNDAQPPSPNGEA